MAEAPGGTAEVIEDWLARQLDAEARAWLDTAQAEARGGERGLYMTVSLVHRKLGKTDLALGAQDFEQARAVRPGWDPTGWSVDQAARILLVLRGGGTGETLAQRLKTLFSTADVAETIALLRGLPLYPDPGLHVMRAREGARSNMRPIFEAVAHRNPYPMEAFDENAWNHMVLKALFVGAPLWPIQGLEARANAELARILRDYAHERWAAGRPVTPELWRGVGRFADAEALADLERVLATGGPLEREGAALALADCPKPEARDLLGRAPDLAAAVAEGRATWDGLGRKL